MSTAEFVIGIDGGASKTGALLASLDGAVVINRRAPGSAIIGRPHPDALQVLSGVVRGLLDAAGASARNVRAVVLGLSGIDFADEYDLQFGAVSEGLGLEAGRLTLVNDSVVALAGATQAARATIVQHGTEVTLAYRSGIGGERVFDSHGVADCFDMRRRAVPLLARMIDGRAPATPFLDAALAHYGVPADQFTAFVLRASGAQRAMLTLGPLIIGHWHAGDEAASALVRHAVDDYVVATRAMADRIGSREFTACFGGGTIQVGGQALFRAIQDKLMAACPGASFATAEFAPEIGAAFMALHKLGCPPDALRQSLRAGAAIQEQVS